jgi:hypothetical protein
MWTRRLSRLTVGVGLALASSVAYAGPEPVQSGLPDDPFTAFREPFKLGMDRYRAGALAEAVGYWEPIYRELGNEKGYRLAYDLAVAYSELGDATRAAERLQAFLAEVEARTSRGMELAKIVLKESDDAQARIARLISTKGRIHIEAGTAPCTAQVDASEPRLAGFVAWVAPGEHRITFAAGTADADVTRVRVQAGEIVEVTPKPPLAPPEPVIVKVLSPSPPTTFVTHRETIRPFAWQIIAISGGLAAGAGVAAVPLYNSAITLHDQYSKEPLIALGERKNFATARTLAYSVAGGAIGMAAVTAGLAAWYFGGSSERETRFTPTLQPERGGAVVGVSARY